MPPIIERPTAPPLLLWSIWAILFASLFVPLALTHVPQPFEPLWERPISLDAAYAVGIAICAIALLLRRKLSASPLVSLSASGLSTTGLTWLGFAVWTLDHDTPAFHVLLAMAAIVFWSIRPRAHETR